MHAVLVFSLRVSSQLMYLIAQHSLQAKRNVNYKNIFCRTITLAYTLFRNKIHYYVRC